MVKHTAVMLSSALVVLVSCGGPDQKALDTYFKSVRNGDRTALAGVSAIEFPEAVQSWHVVEIGPESVAPFPLKDLNRTLREAKMDLQFFAEKDYLFLSDNQHLYKRYKAEIEKNPDAELKGELGEFQREHLDIRKKGEEAERAVEEANRALQREKLAAGISLMGATVTDDLDGEVVTKEARVNVTTSAGEKSYLITLKNYKLVNQQHQANIRSRWIVADVQAQGS
jgi:hypothetical protein